jgi:hypothetical protein
VLNNPIRLSDPDGKEPFDGGKDRFPSSASVSMTVGMSLGSHEIRGFVKLEGSVMAYSIAEVNTSLVTSWSLSRFGRFESNFRGRTTSITVGGLVGYDTGAMIGWSRTGYFSKSFSEFGAGATKQPSGDVMSKTDQWIGTYALRVGSKSGLNFTSSVSNDTRSWGGDGGDSYLTGNVKAQVQLAPMATSKGSFTRLAFGAELDIVTGKVDRDKEETKGTQRFYRMEGPFSNLSQGALTLNLGIDHLRLDPSSGTGSLYQAGLKVGVDSEQIRNGVQNRLIHDRIGLPHVPMVEGKPPRMYINAEGSSSKVVYPSQ